MANAGAKLSSFPEVNDIQTGDMFPLLSGGNTNAKIDYATLADAIIAKLKSETGDGVLSINGKTGAVTINKSDVGLGNVDNTSDADKPISTAVQEALDDKANNAVSEIINDHINNKNNPHVITKAQVGLGSVVNLDQSKAIKSITRSGTTFTATALDGTTTTFTQQDSSTMYDIATSSADGLMSKTDKAKLDGISSGADASPIKTVKVNGTALTPDSDKAVNVTVPTLANNATTTSAGMALDARMGKTLSDQASQFAKNTAQIESAGTATNAHSVGEYVMISNALYKVTAAVAKGDAWTIGTNVTAANVGSEISSLKSDLAKSFESVHTEITTGFTSPVKSGKVRISRWGKFCVVDIDISIESNLDDWKLYKICEIPQSTYTRSTGICYGINRQRPVILQVDGTTLSLNTQGGTQAAVDTYQGQVVYVS